VLLEGSPAEALTALDGQIWSRVVATDEELRALEARLNIVSTHLVGGQHEIRVFSPSSPGAEFRAAASGLEDVYFLNLSRHSKH
jgi:ABC-2 type transport system ATP-binding protein